MDPSSASGVGAGGVLPHWPSSLSVSSADMVWLALSNGGGLSRKNPCSRRVCRQLEFRAEQGCEISSLRVSGCFHVRLAQVWCGCIIKLAVEYDVCL